MQTCEGARDKRSNKTEKTDLHFLNFLNPRITSITSNMKQVNRRKLQELLTQEGGSRRQIASQASTRFVMWRSELRKNQLGRLHCNLPLLQVCNDETVKSSNLFWRAKGMRVLS